jgi:hypothetical protein
MSRLDSFIRRLEAQRICLAAAAAAVRDLEGPVLELGLGNGRTYDHLRELCPQREIFVFERKVAAHPDCIPPAGFLLLGDMRDSLPAVRGRFEGRVALAHLDLGTGDVEASRELAREVAALIVPLLRPRAVLVSEPPIARPELIPSELPREVAPGRYHMYRRLSFRSSP